MVVAYTLSFNGKEIRGRLGKVFVLTFAILLAIVMVVVVGGTVASMALAILGFVLIAFVLTLPAHFLLRACGRRGFYVCSGENSHEWTWKGSTERVRE